MGTKRSATRTTQSRVQSGAPHNSRPGEPDVDYGEEHEDLIVAMPTTSAGDAAAAAIAVNPVNTASSQQQQQRDSATVSPPPVAPPLKRAPTDSDESSEESFLDSLEEGRTPLLREDDAMGGEADDEFDYAGENSSRARAAGNRQRSDYSTTQAANEDAAEKRALRRLPDERWKTGLAALMLFMAGLSNDVVLSFVHNRLPETAPLPDVIFENTPYWPWALTVSEYLMVTLVSSLLLLAVCHKHRWILLRRIATIGALLYFGRCVTLFLTQVPKADRNYYCSPKLEPNEQTFWNIFVRGLRVLGGLGLQVNGKNTLCGDYIYSGHTIVHVTCYLFIREYSPKRWYILHYAAMFFAAVGVFCLLVSRGHYSIDVVIAYYIATRVFWEYHTMANVSMLRSAQQGRNHLVKTIWFPLFRFMEANVLRPVPRRYAAPFRLPSFR